MIDTVDWWCPYCKKEGFVADSMDVSEIARRVRKSHKQAAPECEVVTPAYRRSQDLGQP